MNNRNQFEEPFDATPPSVETTEGEQGKEKKEVPTPPPSKAGVRTMQSDIKSLQESGGQAPQPYSIEIDHQEAEKEEPIFQPSVTAAPLPPSAGKQSPAAEPPKNKKTKILFIILAILILGIVFALTGYYIVAPHLFQSPVATSTPTQTQAPAPSPVPTATSTLETISSEEIILSPLTLENFKNTLKAAAANIPLNKTKELVLRDENRSLINLSDLFPLLFPEFKKEEIVRFFPENFSLAVFVDNNGSWPVFVIQLKPTAALIGAQSFIKEKIEASPQRTNFHYGWIKDKLIISTSASGYAAILQKIK